MVIKLMETGAQPVQAGGPAARGREPGQTGRPAGRLRLSEASPPA